MKKSVNVILLFLLVVGSFLGGSWYSQQPAARSRAAGERRILYYQDPMHPAYKSEKPGVAPDCGMQLEPVYTDDSESGRQGPRDPLPAGTVQIVPEKQQIIGVKIEEVIKGSEFHVIRVPGRVSLDETRVFRIAAPVDGWVRSAGPMVTGSIVRKDEVLATFYNRDFLTGQQSYLYALDTMDRFKDNEGAEQLKLTQAQLQAAEENLEFLGMGETQLREIARSRKIAKDIEFRSPAAGLVLAHNAFPGLRFDRGSELFRIADVSHIWILAEIYENEVRYFRPGASVRVILPQLEKVFQAKISDVPPQFDPNSHTFKMRLETNNPGYALRPEMFADVELPVSLASTITIPVDAILDSGRKKTVFVSRENGFFEPREVQTGLSFGERVEIIKGLLPRERVVVSGTFLVDSESRLQGTSGFGRVPTQVRSQ
jgi:Cu(I)/Ag(I) efflux system membrane fusion protein